MIDKSGKVILVDCDGVLVDWSHSFGIWMEEHGYSTVPNVSDYDISKTYGITKSESKVLVRHFNESATICCIPPMRDAIKYIKRIHEELGYVFHCITSLSNNEHAGTLRRQNIENLFGKTAFEKIVCLDTGEDKDDALAPYLDTGCIFVEDKPANAELGARLGLTAVLMTHDFTRDYFNDDVAKVDSWKEIYEMVS
jgi:FMN phosphatase YigB (HAD superfamily)